MALGAACLSSAPPAPAPDGTGAVSSYAAPSECPDASAWRAALHTRLEGRLALLPERLSVEIVRRENAGSAKYAGWVSAGAGPARHGRQIDGATCAEVFEALALIAVLGLERAGSEPPATDAAEGPDLASWRLTAAQESELARDPVPEQLTAPPPTRGLTLGATALALWGGVAQAELDVDWGAGVTARWNTPSLSPLLLVGAYTGGERIGVSGTGAQASLERLALHAVVCPSRFPRHSAVGLRPCVDLDAGVLSGSGVAVGGARRRVAPWASTGLELRAEWTVWDRIELGAMLGGVLALTRPRFYFVPDTTAFQTPAAGVRAGASASVSF